MGQSFQLVDDLIRMDWNASAQIAASSLTRLSVLLCDLELRDAACKVAGTCVEVYRGFASSATAHLAAYARSLDVHSALLTATQDDPEFAFARSRSAVILFEYLQTQQPGKHGASLATALTNYANTLCELGEYSQALQIIEQSVDIQRGLSHHSSQITTSLCCALHNLAQCLLDVGDAYSTQLALGTISEALDVVEALVHDNSAFQRVLATCLLTYSHCHMKHGRHDQGLRAAERALLIRRTCLVTTGAQRDALLAEAHAHLSACHSMAADAPRAFSAIHGAIVLQRGVVHQAGDHDAARALDALAYYLYRAAMLLARLRRPAEAVRAIEESVGHREQLALQDPVAHNADLAQALHDLGVLLHNGRLYGRAKAAMGRAVAIRKKLFLGDGMRYGRFLFNSEEALKVILYAADGER
jgi:tetratricopeptide (TPR) repeat protein